MTSVSFEGFGNGSTPSAIVPCRGLATSKQRLIESILPSPMALASALPDPRGPALSTAVKRLDETSALIDKRQS